jgi:flagellar FliL protein
MAEQSQIGPESAAGPSQKKSNLLLILIVGAVTLLGGAGATYFFLARGKSASASTAPAKVEKKAPEATVHLESFTVNLNDPDESHFLRVTMDLSVEHAPKGDAKEGGDDSFPMAKTRDTVISVLTAAKANDLLTPEGKAMLKHNVLAALQEKVPEIETKDVYFTEFLVQR